MKKTYSYLVIFLAGIFVSAATKHDGNRANGFALGTPDIQSVTALTFGHDGILFIGDSKGGSVIAVDTKDNQRNSKGGTGSMTDIDQKIAAALGTTKENITITDMAVNPLSRKIYISIHNSDGTPAILKIEEGNIKALPLQNIPFSSITLNNVYDADAKDGRGRPLRVSTISDIKFDKNKVLLSGLSNKEFSSSFRSIPFPFTNNQEQASLEIYHAAHGRYETAAPIKTFTTGTINGKEYLIASYTCTPLVLFPMENLKPGAHVKGRTIAEMGSGNTPIDMITIKEGNESFLLMANTARAVSKVSFKNMERFEGTLTEKVTGTAGTDFTQLGMAGVQQMDKLDNHSIVIIQKNTNGNLNLDVTNGEKL